jgi:hypothetical protein
MFGKKRSETLPEDQVHLKALFGIRPGVYLAGLYGLIIFIILFFFLFYPGIKNPGSLLIVTSEPEGAAIRVDGVYQAAAPAQIFVPKGTRRLTVSLAGFTEWQKDTDIAGGVFASLIFPKKTLIKVTLEAPDPVAALNQGAAGYAAWSFAGEPTAAYQIPLSLSESAYQTAPEVKGNAAVMSGINETLKAASRFVSNNASARDLIRSKYLIDNAGLSPSPLTLAGSGQDILVFLSENPASAQILASLLPAETASVLAGSAWYKKQIEAAAALEAQKQFVSQNQTNGRFEVNGVFFSAIPAGALTQMNRIFAIDGFGVAETGILPESWEAFLAANPEWKKENTTALIARGYVTEDYLEDTGQTMFITGVSWYAAKAYCAWLTAFLEDKTLEVRLPFEREWEYAAVNGLFPIIHLPMMDTSGLAYPAVWCADHFAPLNALAAKPESIAEVGSPERSVRGGRYMKPEDRGSLPPDFCSPFVSFQPVIAQKGTNYE